MSEKDKEKEPGYVSRFPVRPPFGESTPSPSSEAAAPGNDLTQVDAVALPPLPTDAALGDSVPGASLPPPPPTTEVPLPRGSLLVRLADGLPPARKQQLRRVVGVLALFVLGAVLGLALAPEGPRELRAQLAAEKLHGQSKEQRIAQLEQQLRDADRTLNRAGKLRPADRARHEREGRRYSAALRRVQAQSAAELMDWFVARWDQLLDAPQSDDRVGRRAATLSLLVGGMVDNLNPGDYVPWQLEFWGGTWLGEVNFDMDGDGLPGLRSGKNTHDGFANTSVCQVAMALNQAVVDAHILMMPEMRCDRVEARMSVFLQGPTFDDALNEFVAAVRDQGFIVVEKLEKNTRLILVGARTPANKP